MKKFFLHKVVTDLGDMKHSYLSQTVTYINSYAWKLKKS